MGVRGVQDLIVIQRLTVNTLSCCVRLCVLWLKGDPPEGCGQSNKQIGAYIGTALARKGKMETHGDILES